MIIFIGIVLYLTGLWLIMLLSVLIAAKVDVLTYSRIGYDRFFTIKKNIRLANRIMFPSVVCYTVFLLYLIWL